MEEIRCIFCDKKNDRVAVEENGYKGRKCSQCGLIYISPRPSINEIVDLYGHDQAHISAEAHISGEFSKRLYAKHILKIIKSYSKNLVIRLSCSLSILSDKLIMTTFEAGFSSSQASPGLRLHRFPTS